MPASDPQPRSSQPRSVRSRYTPEQLQARREALPRPSFPPELPVSARREDIARAIAENPVVIVCGETGSGKTTQLPKICLELGRGVNGLIGHTQPRRIAARATASRIAQELQCELGTAVGYKIRFNDRTSASSYIKLMTDGILLAETQTDRLLQAYDTIIIDEAHERSLNIDFLLGYLRQLVCGNGPGQPPRRPDLKVIITSATLDAERFARHFASTAADASSAQAMPAPVIEVSGRMYPVEVRYRPPAEDEDGDINDAIAQAVDELAREGEGDVLVFLPGEREIREAAEVLRKHHQQTAREAREILPLFARLSVQEQQRVFAPHSSRRIVLATNVAETSLTVPGIRYVVDAGQARIKRYSYRNKVEQLRTEPVSQSAARQRAGRCGRVQAGVCIRLYAEQDFESRPLHTDPEVLRSSLAGVILRMKSLGLGEVEAFAFVDAPAPKAVSDGYALLSELGAVQEDSRQLTELGRQLARLPLDPRIGRMILAARSEGALAEVLVIASALALQDPRERPMERAQTADAAHKLFADERSDFLSYLKLWRFFEQALAHHSQRKLQRLCRDHFLSFNRMREWRDIHAQLKEMVQELGWPVPPDDATADLQTRTVPIHRALMTGLLGNIGLKSEEGHYLGARGIRFWIHPGSGMQKKAGRWIMAAELVETTRLYARCVASIEPQWLESLGSHLLRRSQAEPHWEKQRAQVVALERATLYGLPVYTGRRVHYGPMDPATSREIFIRQALVAGEWESRAPFFSHNHRLVREIEHLEHKSRRPDVLVDEELIFAFYDHRLPPDLHNGAAFEAWRKQVELKDGKLLFLNKKDLMRHEAAGITTAQFPHQLEMAGRTLAVEYRHEPGSHRDGITLTLPLIALNQISAAQVDWLVPGLRREKVMALAKSLPPRLRHRLGPLADFAAAFLDDGPDGGVDTSISMSEAIARWARRELNLELPRDGFRLEALPPHLQMNLRVLDEHGRQLGFGRNLAQLRSELGGAAEQRFASLAAVRSRIVADTAPAAIPSAPTAATAVTAAASAKGNANAATPTAASASAAAPSTQGCFGEWSFGELAEIMEIRHGGQTLIGFPALVDQGEGVTLEVFDAEERAQQAHRAGLRRLFLIQLKEQVRFIEKNLPGFTQLALQYASFGDAGELRTQLLQAAFDRACLQPPLPRDAAAFEARLVEARSRVSLIAQELARLLAALLVEHNALRKKLKELARAAPEVCRDIEEQLTRLLPRGFVSALPFERLTHCPRYLKAALLRLEKYRDDPARDARAMSELRPLQTQWLRSLAASHSSRGAGSGIDPQLEQFGWMLEELRVQLFAQTLRTPVPVSAKRLQKLWESLQR